MQRSVEWSGCSGLQWEKTAEQRPKGRKCGAVLPSEKSVFQAEGTDRAKVLWSSCVPGRAGRQAEVQHTKRIKDC